MLKPVLMSIADCNHGFFTPEHEECESLAQSRINVQLQCFDCSQDDFVRKCQDSDIIAVQRLVVNRDNMSQIPSCKVVTRMGVGLDNINLEDMNALGIKVVYFPDFCTQEVANHALAMILSLYRRLPFIRESQRDLDGSLWGKPILLDGVESAARTTIGVLGAGRIGLEVIRRLEVCGFNVIAHDPYIRHESLTLVPLNDLFSCSDIVTIHCSLTDETKHMVDYPLMKSMKPGSCLINTARGEVIASEDLLKVLSENHLRSAYIDVCDPEPADAKLLSHNRLYVTPHIAFYSWGSLDSLKRDMIKKSVKAFYGM